MKLILASDMMIVGRNEKHIVISEWVNQLRKQPQRQYVAITRELLIKKGVIKY